MGRKRQHDELEPPNIEETVEETSNVIDLPKREIEEHEEVEEVNLHAIAVLREIEEQERLDRDYFEKMPPGYRFLPTGEEIISCYLNNKVLNKPLPLHRIREVNVYRLHPEQLTSMYKAHRIKEWYFFTPRTKKYPNGTRPARAAGNGYWKATGADTDIFDEPSGVKIGSKKVLVYYVGKPKDGIKTDWIMHEYVIASTITNNVAPVINADANNMKLDDWVLCKMYKKTSKANEQHSISQEEQETENVSTGTNIEIIPNQNLIPIENEQVSNPKIRHGLHGECFNNIVHFQVHNEQVPNLSERHPRLDNVYFDNTARFEMHKEQVLNPNTKHVGLSGMCFNNDTSFPMRNEQVPNPDTAYEHLFWDGEKTKQEKDSHYFPGELLYNDDIFNPNALQILDFSSEYLSFQPSNDQAMGMYYDVPCSQTDDVYDSHIQDALQEVSAIIDYPEPLQNKDEEQLKSKDRELPESLDNTITRQDQAFSSKEKKSEG